MSATFPTFENELCQRHNGPSLLRQSFLWVNFFWSSCVANLATYHLQVNNFVNTIWGGTTCISCKLGHQVAPLALIQKLVTGLCRYLHWFQIWPPGCIVTLHCLGLPIILALSVFIELVSSSARVTSVKCQKCLERREWRTSEPKDRTPGLPGVR